MHDGCVFNRVQLFFTILGEKSSCSSRFAQNISFVVSFFLVPRAFFIIAQALHILSDLQIEKWEKILLSLSLSLAEKCTFRKTRRVSGRVISSNKSL
jgi:hypothetical protein